MAQQIKKLVERGLGGICSGSSLIGLVFFLFLPCISVSCQNTEIASQNGMQIIYGGASVNEDLKRGESRVKEEQAESDTAAYPMLLYPIGLVIAGGAGVSLLIGHTRNRFKMHALVGSVAAVSILLVYFIMGFPIEHEVAAAGTTNGTSGNGPPVGAMLNVERTGWLIASFFFSVVSLVAAASMHLYEKIIPS